MVISSLVVVLGMDPLGIDSGSVHLPVEGGWPPRGRASLPPFESCRPSTSLHAVARLRYDTAVVGKPELPPLTVLVKHPEQVVELCHDCRSQGRFAFDTEFVMEDRYETEVCLIQIATESSVAIIDPFLGLDLGEISCPSLCRRLRSMERYKFTPLIFITHDAGDPRVVEAFCAGADDFIVSPMNLVTVRARLKGHLQRMDALDAQTATLPGLYLTGSPYRGVGIPDCIRQGKETARALGDRFKPGEP